MLYAILAVIILIADQWVKYWTTVNIVLDTGEAAFIPGFIKLVNVHNSGAAFGFLSSAQLARWLFIIIAVVFVVLVIFAIVKKAFPGKFATLCCTLAIAGALGNCIDRFLYGYVVDMFKAEFINFAVFNVADIFLVLSCILFSFYLLFGYNGKEEAAPDKQKKNGKTTRNDGFFDETPDDEFILSEIDSAFAPEDESKPVSALPQDADQDANEKLPTPQAHEEKDEADPFSLDAIIDEFK